MLEHKRPLRVFLCHASADKPAVRKFYERLKSEGWIDPWLDEAKLLPGQDWRLVIRQSLADADSVIIFISRTSINKEGFVQREMNYAWDLALEKPRNTIFLVPVRLEECDVPFDLRERQWADYFGGKMEETYAAILQSLKLRYDQKLQYESEEGAGKRKEPHEQEDPDARYPAISMGKHNDVYYRQADLSTILEELIGRQSREYLANGYSVELLKRGIKKAIDVVGEELRRVARKIDTVEEVICIVTNVTADEEVGRLIARVMDELGIDVPIILEESVSIQTEPVYVQGMEFDRGYLSPAFLTDTEHMQAVISDASILINEEKISAAEDIVPLLEKLVQTGKRDLVIIAEDIDGEALATLVLNRVRGMLNVLAVRAPGSGDHRRAMLQDIAILTGGTLIPGDTGRRLYTTTLQDLGRADKVISDKEKTTIVGGKGKKSDIEGRIREIRAAIDKSTSDYDKEKLKERLARLSGGVAIIRVGALSEMEAKKKFHLVKEGLAAAQSAIKNGVVPGNGVAYLHCMEALDKYKTNLQHEKLGISIIRNVLDAPIRMLAVRAGLDGAAVLDNILRLSKEKDSQSIGYNIFTEEYVDLIEAGIIETADNVIDTVAKAARAAIERMLSQ